MNTTCNMCKNIKTKDEITPGYCEAYSPSELAHCVEGFTSYTVEMDKDKYKEVYEYEYENDSLLYDSKNNKQPYNSRHTPVDLDWERWQIEFRG